jgi:hypothetical protein
MVVKAIISSDGKPFKGAVSLGFETPKGTLVQRAETYVKQLELEPFPQFYRVVNKENGRVFGYSFDLPAEASTLSYGHRHELVTGYDEMTEDDHRLSFYLFRSESEAEACVLGVTAAEVVGQRVGVIKERHGHKWVVLLDYYEELADEINPTIRSFIQPSPRVMATINGERRKTG